MEATTTKVCPACIESVPVAAHVCKSCGYKFDWDKRNRGVIIGVVAAVFVVLVLAGVAFYVNSSNNARRNCERINSEVGPDIVTGRPVLTC